MSRKNVSSKHSLSFDELAENWLREIGISDVTRRAYRMELDRFLLWASSEGATPGTLDPRMVEKFGHCVSSTNPRDLQPLGISKPLLASSLGQSRRIIGAWLRWAVAQGAVHASLAEPVEWPEIDRKSLPSKALSAKRLCKVISPIPKKEKASLAHVRERFVAGLAFWLCLSPAEIAALRRRDLKIRNNELVILVSDAVEGMEWMSAPMSVLQSWVAYDQVRGTSKHAVTDLRHSRPVSTLTVTRIIRQIKLPYGEDKKPRSLNARDLRRSFVQHAIQFGWSSDDLQRHLRRQTIRNAKIPREGREQWQKKIAALDAALSSPNG